MHCGDCKQDEIKPEHMATYPAGVCRACAYRVLPNGAALAATVNEQASRRLAVIREAQARRAPSHPTEAEHE